MGSVKCNKATVTEADRVARETRKKERLGVFACGESRGGCVFCM